MLDHRSVSKKPSCWFNVKVRKIEFCARFRGFHITVRWRWWWWRRWRRWRQWVEGWRRVARSGVAAGPGGGRMARAVQRINSRSGATGGKATVCQPLSTRKSARHGTLFRVPVRRDWRQTLVATSTCRWSPRRDIELYSRKDREILPKRETKGEEENLLGKTSQAARGVAC